VPKRKRHDSSNGGNQSSADRNDVKPSKKQRTRLPSSASDVSGPDNSSFDGQQHYFDSKVMARTVYDLVKNSSVAWNGLLTLKNSAFHVQMHLVCGNPNLVHTLMCDSTNGKLTCLKLTQRLRLEHSKLEEVQRRIQLAKDEWSILVGVPGSGNAEGLTAGMQERSLKNLVTYFRQKDAAGVLSLPPNSGHGQETGLLHAFSPCTFAHSYLLQNAPHLDLDNLAEDYIVIILVRVNL
jgi:RNA-binding protein 15